MFGGRWDELGAWDWHTYTPFNGATYKMRKLMRNYCIALGTQCSVVTEMKEIQKGGYR